jgi:hypothetical protein
LAALEYPLVPTPSIAVLDGRIAASSGVHCLPAWDAASLELVRPLALAGPFQSLARVASLMRAGDLVLLDLRYPLLVFSHPREGALSAGMHEDLWRWFGLPCFEQIRGTRGRLLAQECDARDGFHLCGDVDPRLLGGKLLSEPCACGQTTPRMRLAPRRQFAAGAGAGAAPALL